MKTIPYFDLKRQYKQIGSELEKRIIKTLKSTNYALGPEVDVFEKEFSKFIKTNHCVGVNTGTSALHLSLRAFEIGPGDEVITVSMTFIATIMAISYTGAKPVFVDIDEFTQTIDPNLIEEKITNRTKAILLVHLYGQCAEMDKIIKIARKHNLFVIEDSSQAHGAKYKNLNAGSIGDIGTFSFYPGKNLGACGEGGAITTNNKKIFKKIRDLRNWSQPIRYKHTDISYNYRMDGIQASSLIVKVKYLNEWTKKRRFIAKLYQNEIDTKKIKVSFEGSNRFHVYHVFSVFSNKSKKLKKYLNRNSIDTNNHYPIPVHLQRPYLSLGYSQKDLPITENLSKSQLSIPIFPEMKISEAKNVAKAINKFNSKE